ncbi:MAPEG family protein [Kaistia nematophila]|uniref:MAPEG family protein n=1 Tax=Kaistia nematophila TaxID=2994654 RepID=A0A9X3E114_9HYPH|nr:MAPEG family protein [Kaistia nematophila]MCX5569063.1 MAPEG family protein [Kaistia nematophila]
MLKTVILWPAIAQFALIALCYLWLGITRRNAVTSGAVASTDFPPGVAEPDASATARRHLANQFELPLLFFVVVGFLFGVDGVSILELVVAWLFVASRFVHTIASLRGLLALRHASFFIGFVLVCLLWLDLAVRIL